MRADIVVDMQRRVLLTVALLQPFSSGSFLGHTECDFPVVFNRAEELERFSSCRGRTPVLLRGFMNEWWPHNLSIEAFTEMYGDYQVKVGSESSIVLSHGRAVSAIKIKDYLDQINCSEPDRFGSPSESFVFDTDILNTMSNDSFSVYMRPSILNEGFSESSLAAMKVLSMGGANSGLSFHVHGGAWLGLVNFMGLNVAKRWLALPPEIDSPLDAIGGFNPYVPVAKQFRALLKGMQSDTSFSANTNANMKAGILFDNITDSTVLHCLQRPGDIVYIPDGWPHMTLNEGPAIGVGEQRVWLADDREAFCRAVLRKRPKNYDCLKGLAIALQSKLNMKDSISDNESKNNTRFEITNLLRIAISMRPLYPECRLMLSEHLLSSSHDTDSAAGLVEAQMAEDVLDKLVKGVDTASISSKKGLSVAYYRLGSVLAKQRHIDAAIRILSKSLELDEYSVFSLSQLALLYRSIGNVQALLIILDAMENITPNHPLIRKMRETVANDDVLSHH